MYMFVFSCVCSCTGCACECTRHVHHDLCDLCTAAWRRSARYGGSETSGEVVSAHIRRTQERGVFTSEGVRMCVFTAGNVELCFEGRMV